MRRPWPALLLLCACAPLPATRLPVVEAQRLTLTCLTPREACAQLRVELLNPNLRPLKLSGFAGQLILAGQAVGEVTLSGAELAPQGSAALSAPLRLAVTPETAPLWEKAACGEAPYRLDGVLRADLGGEQRFGPYTLTQGFFSP